MKNIKLLSVFFIILIYSCDKEFASIDSDVISAENAINFNTSSIDYPIVASNLRLNPVKSNNLPSFMLGYNNNPFYGESKASFLGQVVPAEFSPSFGENVVLDSVVLTIPYYSRGVDTDDDGNISYEIDSVYGNTATKLYVYKSNFYLRDFNPSGDFSDSQNYYSNGALSNSESINQSEIEAELLYESGIIGDGSDDFIPSSERIDLTSLDSLGESYVASSIAPAVRLKLNNPNDNFWQSLFFENEGNPELINPNTFKEFFRGLYIKADGVNSEGSMMLLNFASSNTKLTIHYTSETSTDSDTDSGGTSTETITSQNEYVLNFTDNLVNIYENNFQVDVSNSNTVEGDERIYLKGGEGYMSTVDLFGGDIQDDNGEMVNAFDHFKNSFYDEENEIANKIINEAYIEFFVDQTQDIGSEPDRIYLYNFEQNTALIDYFLDQSVSSTTINAKINHLEPLTRDGDSITGEGVKYKIRITEHLNNLILRDSTNAKLALVVTSNVGSIDNFSILNSGEEERDFPSGAILTPKGTVLHGSQSEDLDKRPRIKIYYTDPNE
ncbi:DUF4270 domain-containing protein [Flavobacteriaceae bacterium]|nr:DUF4270 domain-containing protein [Flavobacteriaceae bacterium]MDA9849663.1 DUF4270 domain-containing protein [Flavobacteriaceae bacterium]MDB2599417.1 DUF4270 domain-containing protein [Flavobacteriaceae bacterium]MDC0654658.1 DUF4270 domain-containing protein [Flavobacteriaceae bacterium]